MIRTILASFVLLTASTGFALGTNIGQTSAPCVCCQECKCEECGCDELGCACDVGGECACDQACCATCCSE